MSTHQSPSFRFGAVAFALVLTTGGCLPDAVNTTTPSATPGPAQVVANPEAARAHLNAVLATMQTNSINRDTIDWASFRTEVLAAVDVSLREGGTFSDVWAQAFSETGLRRDAALSAPVLEGRTYDITLGYTFPNLEYELRTSLRQ